MKTSAEEELLIVRCLKHDPEAMKLFCSTYGRPLYGFLRTLYGTRAGLAYDLMIHTMADFLRTASPFGLQEYVLVSLMRRLLHSLKQHLKNKESAGPLPGLEPRLAILFECLACLPWEERTALLLRDQMDFDYEEMASILSQPLEAVKTRLKEARIHLHEQIDQRASVSGAVS